MSKLIDLDQFLGFCNLLVATGLQQLQFTYVHLIPFWQNLIFKLKNGFQFSSNNFFLLERTGGIWKGFDKDVYILRLRFYFIQKF